MRKHTFSGVMVSIFLAFIMLLTPAAHAAGAAELSPGDYYLSGNLSCYINAMGGVEFGAPMLTGVQAKVTADGSSTITLFLTKSQVEIYSIVCDTFIDADPAGATQESEIPCGTLGYYDETGRLITESVTYTLSEDTAENSAGEQVPYVNSITFPAEQGQDTFYLTMYINSNVMGTQFARDEYPAVLTVDWSSAATEPGAVSTQTESAPESEVPSADETMGGLNIYRPETQDGTGSSASEGDENLSASYDDLIEVEAQIAFFRMPVIIAVAAAGVAAIGIGVVFLMLGRKEKSAHETKD